MFESFRENMKSAVDSIQATYNDFTDSIDRFNQDMAELRDWFVGIKNIIVSICSFMGQQTAVLLLLTFVFLFVINMIPFLFLDKKVRYYIGIALGVWLSFHFDYTLWSTAKYLLIMLSPVIIEYILVKVFKLTGKSLGALLKKGAVRLWDGMRFLFSKIVRKAKNKDDDEKTGSQTPKNL